MSVLKSLLLAIDVATRRRDEAARRLARADEQLQATRAQGAQLESYARETGARWIRQAQHGAAPELMHNHYQFMGQLEHAMGLQRQIAEQRLRETEVCRRQLLDAECRLASLQQLCERRRSELLVAQNRREQRQTDEMAAQRHRLAQARQRA